MTEELWGSVLPVWYFATPTEHPLAPLDQSMDASIRSPEIFGNNAPSKNERYRSIPRPRPFKTLQQEAADSIIRFRENALEESKAEAPTLSSAVALARDTSRAIPSPGKYLRDPASTLELQPRTGVHIHGTSVALLNPSETAGQDQYQGRGRGQEQEQDRAPGAGQGRGGFRGRGGYASRQEQAGRGT